MSHESLILGGVYRSEWDDSPSRVIGFDEIEVFYDCLLTHNTWAFSGNLNKKCYFYRTSAPLFIKKSEQIGFIPLSEEEEKVFRPDLPLRLGRTKQLSWNNIKTADYKSFEKCLALDLLQQKLQTDKIVLLPNGNNGGRKRGVTVTANNSKYIECGELLWKAKELQESVNSKVSNGIGIYRIGFEKKLPSYYIGEYIDAAGLFKE